jgi:hypothetical protein
MNVTAKVVKPSLIGALLVCISIYVGIAFGASTGKHPFVGQAVQKAGAVFLLAEDRPKPCPMCRIKS